MGGGKRRAIVGMGNALMGHNERIPWCLLQPSPLEVKQKWPPPQPLLYYTTTAPLLWPLLLLYTCSNKPPLPKHLYRTSTAPLATHLLHRVQRRGEGVVEERRRHVQATPALGRPAGQHHRPHRPTGSWAGSDSRKQAAPAHGIPAGQCHRSQRSTGSRAGIVGQLKAIRAPERRLLGNFKQPEPPPPPLGRRNPLFRSVSDGQSRSGPYTTTRSPATGFSGRRARARGWGGGEGGANVF